MRRVPAKLLSLFLLTALRCALLAVQFGAAAGLAAMFLMCLGGCGGYAEAIYGAGVAILAALVAFVGLLVRYLRLLRDDPAAAGRQARWQWIWLGVSAFLLALFV